ncbi:MAG: hypothetical protein JSW46_07620 [Gemmatimonadota bacterium]|nr:MAG: hypothetical protein JSW46_07620 [Gemmatimonadota bacterium]
MSIPSDRAARPGDWEIAWRRPPARGIIFFVVGYALVDLLPVILPATPVFNGLALKDLADALLIFFLIVLYVELGLRAKIFRSLRLRAAYIFALLLMVQGHAVHFAANAITGVSERSDAGWRLADFLDEHWGHIELHIAFIILAAIFIGCSRSADAAGNEPVLSRTEKAGLALVILTYGILLAGDAVEGQTVPLMLPCAIVLCAWGLWPYVRGLGNSGAPVQISLYRRFFATSFGITVIALVIYGLITGGFPELSTLAAAG